MIETTMRLITAIILLMSAILSVFGNFPWWVVPILAFVFLSLAGPKAYKLFTSTLQKRAKQKKEQQLVERHWGELRRLAADLQGVTEPNRVEIAGTVFNIAKRAVPEKQNDYYNPHDFKWTIHVLAAAIVSLLDVQTKSRASFTASAQLLEAVLSFWHRYAADRARALRKELEASEHKLSPYEKEEFNRTRKWHTDLMDDYIRFAKAVDADFGEPMLRQITQDPVPDIW